VTENLGNRLDWCSVVVQPRTETTAESVEAVPLDARAHLGSALMSFAPAVRLPNKRLDSDLLYNLRLLLSRGPLFGLATVFEDAIAGCLVVGVDDDDAPIPQFALCCCHRDILLELARWLFVGHQKIAN
jgi:hypothetical protein